MGVLIHLTYPDRLRHLCALYAPTPTYQMDLGTAQHVGLPERAGLRPENCQFFGLQDKVPRRKVLRTGDEGMQAENWGFLAWRTNSRPISERDYYKPTGWRLCYILFRADGFWC